MKRHPLFIYLLKGKKSAISWMRGNKGAIYSMKGQAGHSALLTLSAKSSVFSVSVWFSTEYLEWHNEGKRI